MSMTDEEFLRLQAEFEGGATKVAPPTGAMPDEEFQALQAQFEPAMPPLRAAQNAPYMDAIASSPPPEEATTMENIRYGAGGVPQGYADVADMGYFTGQAMDAVGEYVPSSVKSAFRDIAPHHCRCDGSIPLPHGHGRADQRAPRLEGSEEHPSAGV